MEPVRKGPMAEVLPAHTPGLFRAAVARAVAALRAGEVVALPTETVYGLAANALDPQAVARIFAVKGRPAHNPIIVHVAGLPMARECVSAWPALAQKLAAAFWPGPLTLVLRRADRIPDIVTARGPTVGVRWPSHPLIQAVIRACGFPLAAPSANPSGQVSPTTAAQVRKGLGPRIGLIIDGGPSEVGIESTVLDLTTDPPRILRPGMVHAESLVAVAGRVALAETGEGGPLKSPGLLLKHYSPKARLLIRRWRNEPNLRAQVAATGVRPAKVHLIAHRHIPAPAGWGGVSVLPHDPAAFARAIYAALDRCDDAGAALIVVEALPPGPQWHALADRLRRAAA